MIGIAPHQVQAQGPLFQPPRIQETKPGLMDIVLDAAKKQAIDKVTDSVVGDDNEVVSSVFNKALDYIVMNKGGKVPPEMPSVAMSKALGGPLNASYKYSGGKTYYR